MKCPKCEKELLVLGSGIFICFECYAILIPTRLLDAQILEKKGLFDVQIDQVSMN